MKSITLTVAILGALTFANLATACQMRDGAPFGHPVVPTDGSPGFNSYSDAMAAAAGLYGAWSTDEVHMRVFLQACVLGVSKSGEAEMAEG